MKLEKYVDKSIKKRKIILLSISLIVLVCVSFLLYKTFANFSEEVEFPMIKGQVDYFGNSDVYFAFYQGDKELEEMPKKDNEDNLVFDHGECDNGASIEWNEDEWAPLVKNLKQAKTKCSLYFGYPTAVKFLNNLGKKEPNNLIADGTKDNNLRYVGGTANNYIDIGDRTKSGDVILWRIIGVMNNVTTLNGEEKQESVVKLIRNDHLYAGVWDSSASDVNNGEGVNEWSQADMMKIFNPGYEDNEDLNEIGEKIKVSNSLYWNNEKGNCYAGTSNKIGSCDFTSSGISKEARDKVSKIRWNTGTGSTPHGNLDYNMPEWIANYAYTAERSANLGKVCEESSNCNDKVERKPTWDGYVALLYPSDYGFAVGGEVRDTCLETSMERYSQNEAECNNADWINPGYWQILLTPSPNSESASYMFRTAGSWMHHCPVTVAQTTLPVLHLKSNVKITTGNGTKENPYIAE